jgi:hypothetical protein
MCLYAAQTHPFVTLVTVPVRSAPNRLMTAVARSISHVRRTLAALVALVLIAVRCLSLSLVGEVLSSGGVADPKDAVGALDRFAETSTLVRRVRGGVPPHPLPSGERLLLTFPRCAWACFPVVLIVLVLIDSGSCPLSACSPPGLSCPRRWARCGVVVTGNHLRTDAGGDHRAAASPRTADGQSEGSGRAKPRPETNSPPRNTTVTREAMGTPRLSQ